MKNNTQRYNSENQKGYFTHTPHQGELSEENDTIPQQILKMKLSDGDELRFYEENGVFRIKGDADEILSLPFSDLPGLISNLNRFLNGNANTKTNSHE